MLAITSDREGPKNGEGGDKNRFFEDFLLVWPKETGEF